jgi:hypothetical protein
MSVGVGLEIHERIRQTLEPLVEPLRIDGFLQLMMRERARIAAMEAQSTQRIARSEVPAAEPEPKPEGDLAASLQEEVVSFMRRDDPDGTTSSEVAEFMEMMGHGGFDPSAERD